MTKHNADSTSSGWTVPNMNYKSLCCFLWQSGNLHIYLSWYFGLLLPFGILELIYRISFLILTVDCVFAMVPHCLLQIPTKAFEFMSLSWSCTLNVFALHNHYKLRKHMSVCCGCTCARQRFGYNAETCDFRCQINLWNMYIDLKHYLINVTIITLSSPLPLRLSKPDTSAEDKHWGT